MQIKPYQIESFINKIAQNKQIFGALIYGPESGLASIRSRKIASFIVKNLSDPFLVVNLNEKQLEEEPSLLSDEFSSIAMMGGRKLILIDGGNKITESLKIIFEDSAQKSRAKKNQQSQEEFRVIGDNFILINGGDLDKASTLRKFCDLNPYLASIPCYEDDSGTISEVIRQKFREYQLTFEKGVIELFLDKFGKNRQIILNEIDKLSLFLGNKKHITQEILQEIVADIAEVSAYQLVEEFANKDGKKANLFLEKLFAEKTSPITIIKFLTNYFNKLLLVKTNLENGSNLDLEMKIQSVFFKQHLAFKKHLNMWSKKSLRNFLIKFQELEIKCQNSNFDPELLLSAFINFALIKKDYVIK